MSSLPKGKDFVSSVPVYSLKQSGMCRHYQYPVEQEHQIVSTLWKEMLTEAEEEG